MALSKITNASLSTGIDSAKIGAGDVSNTEHAFLNSISSNVQTQIAGAGAKAEACHFHVTCTNRLNVTGNGTNYDCQFDSEISDVGSNFNTTNFTFTAPETGVYLLNCIIKVHGINVGVTDLIFMTLQTSNRDYSWGYEGTDGREIASLRSISILADMDGSDTAKVQLRVTGNGSDTADFKTGSFFSGCQIA
jgi:hypothetical protein